MEFFDERLPNLATMPLDKKQALIRLTNDDPRVRILCTTANNEGHYPPPVVAMPAVPLRALLAISLKAHCELDHNAYQQDFIVKDIDRYVLYSVWLELLAGFSHFKMPFSDVIMDTASLVRGYDACAKLDILIGLRCFNNVFALSLRPMDFERLLDVSETIQRMKVGLKFDSEKFDKELYHAFDSRINYSLKGDITVNDIQHLYRYKPNALFMARAMAQLARRIVDRVAPEEEVDGYKRMPVNILQRVDVYYKMFKSIREKQAARERGEDLEEVQQ